jgi:preprotein translocase subunit SecF
MAVLMLISIVFVVVVALYVGLRFGWRSADTTLISMVPAMASL